MTGDGKVREQTSSVGARMTWLVIALKFYNIVIWLSFAGSADIHISEMQCGSKRVDLRWGWIRVSRKKGRELDEVDETGVPHAFYPLADSARRT